jgi:hypothetical protein
MQLTDDGDEWPRQKQTSTLPSSESHDGIDHRQFDDKSKINLPAHMQMSDDRIVGDGNGQPSVIKLPIY